VHFSDKMIVVVVDLNKSDEVCCVIRLGRTLGFSGAVCDASKVIGRLDRHARSNGDWLKYRSDISLTHFKDCVR